MKPNNLKTILLICGLSAATILSGCSKSPVQDSGEETSAEKALLAYQEILKESPAIEGEHDELYDASFDYEQNLEMFGGHYDQFAVIDINNDEMPELITLSTVNFRWTPVSVFTFRDGNVVLYKDPLEPEAHGTFEQMSVANGAYTTYICEEGHIHNVWRGTTPFGDEVEENYAYKLGESLTLVECTVPENENTIYFSGMARANTAENVDALIH